MKILVLIKFIVFIEFWFVEAQPPCTLEFGVDISKGLLFENGSIWNEGVLYRYGDYKRKGDITVGCICKVKSCLRKCCPVGQFLQNHACVSSNNSFVIPSVRGLPVESYHLVSGSECKKNENRLLLDPRNNTDFFELFFIEESGELFVPSTGKYYPQSGYCVDYIEEDDEIQALICGRDTEKEFRTVYGMIISMPFLLLTFLVYAVLPDRNLHGKCLMCYVSTLFGAYALLIFIQLYPETIEEAACKALGILCLFFFMVSFFWMSVMSIDIFLAFSGRRGFSGSRKKAERKRFILYSIYAWGMPLIQAIIVTSLSLTTDVTNNAWYNPGMGDGQCWLRDGIPTGIYFYLPMATLIIINITLFCTTACKIKRVQQDTAMLRKDESKKHSYENDKQRFNLYVKLLLAMGVNWSLEIISWIVDWRIGHVPPAVWYLTDFCNALYGVFVFFIFVFKQNIWKLLKKRYYMVIGKPNLARTMTNSAYSRRTTGTSLNHSMVTDKGFVNDSSVIMSDVA